MKERFKKVFANVPLGERQNPIYVDQKYGAMSWSVVWIEVEHDTEIGIKALAFLSEANII